LFINSFRKHVWAKYAVQELLVSSSRIQPWGMGLVRLLASTQLEVIGIVKPSVSKESSLAKAASSVMPSGHQLPVAGGENQSGSVSRGSPAAIRVDARTLAAAILDISLSGVRMCVECALPPGSEVTIYFLRTIAVGQVLDCRTDRQGSYEIHLRIFEVVNGNRGCS